MVIGEADLYGITRYRGYYEGSGERPYSITCEGWTLYGFDQWVDADTGEPRWRASFIPTPPVTTCYEDMHITSAPFDFIDDFF